MTPSGMLDWLATSLTMVGFTVLLCLAAYLIFTLIARVAGHSPSNNHDRFLQEEIATDEWSERSITPLAS